MTLRIDNLIQKYEEQAIAQRNDLSNKEETSLWTITRCVMSGQCFFRWLLLKSLKSSEILEENKIQALIKDLLSEISYRWKHDEKFVLQVLGLYSEDYWGEIVTQGLTEDIQKAFQSLKERSVPESSVFEGPSNLLSHKPDNTDKLELTNTITSIESVQLQKLLEESLWNQNQTTKLVEEQKDQSFCSKISILPIDRKVKNNPSKISKPTLAENRSRVLNYVPGQQMVLKRTYLQTIHSFRIEANLLSQHVPGIVNVYKPTKVKNYEKNLWTIHAVVVVIDHLNYKEQFEHTVEELNSKQGQEAIFKNIITRIYQRYQNILWKMIDVKRVKGLIA